jgi:hypothetical protein
LEISSGVRGIWLRSIGLIRAQPVEIDDRREVVAQRIDVEWIEGVRAHEL